MENKINLEELILRQYDEVLNSKDRLEAKAASYLAANALILAVLATFISIIKDMDVLPRTFRFFVFIDMIVFFLGLVNLLVCIIILLPRNLWGFSSEKLLRLHFTDRVSDDDLLLQNEGLLYQNKKVISFVRTGYLFVSVGLLVQIIGFVLASIMFFIILLGA